MTAGKISIYDKLNTVRMVVLMEEEPFSNKYNQVIVDKEQYKALSAFLYDLVAVKREDHECGNPKCDGRSFEVSDESITLPDLREKKE